MSAPQIFDRIALERRRTRALVDNALTVALADDLLDRLDAVRRAFGNVLVVGSDGPLGRTMRDRGATVTTVGLADDRLAVESATFDLVLSSGVLDTVADIPGLLVQMRRALRPDGLILANFVGAPSLEALRSAVAVADRETAVARLHPQIEVRTAGDLLVRAGFALPVADLDTVRLRYRDLGALIRDLRDVGATNALAERHPVTPGWLERASRAFAARADTDGKTTETLSIITLTGWAPAPDQPKPARRGSGEASLSDALRPKGR